MDSFEENPGAAEAAPTEEVSLTFPRELWPAAESRTDVELVRLAGLFCGRGASIRGQKRLVALAEVRRNRLKISEDAYLARLQSDENEWSELWGLADAGPGDGFFRFPAQFDVLGQLLSEMTLIAPERRLRVLSAGCGRGHEAYSLAMRLAETKMAAKGWEISVEGTDLGGALLAGARRADFTREEVRVLTPFSARRWFSVRAAGWHFKTESAPPVSFFQSNLSDAGSETVRKLQGSYDVVFCRGRSFDCPDRQIRRLARSAVSLLAPGGILLTAPGEIWPERNDVSTEERSGLVYLRRTSSDAKPTPFQMPAAEPRRKKAPAGREKPSKPEATDPRRESLLQTFEETLPADPDEARDVVLELLDQDLSAGVLNPGSLGLMARVEEKLGRRESRMAIENFIARWSGPDGK
ncbi:MAG: hypothetical protein LBP95_09705 [Deltaproteobacteria bacterium]|jgi:chemotaxis protein methyltransferase CheR|nr:hypothetical protein [Deltaproteobacteria bacterium]